MVVAFALLVESDEVVDDAALGGVLLELGLLLLVVLDGVELDGVVLDGVELDGVELGESVVTDGLGLDVAELDEGVLLGVLVVSEAALPLVASVVDDFLLLLFFLCLPVCSVVEVLEDVWLLCDCPKATGIPARLNPKTIAVNFIVFTPYFKLPRLHTWIGFRLQDGCHPRQ